MNYKLIFDAQITKVSSTNTNLVNPFILMINEEKSPDFIKLVADIQKELNSTGSTELVILPRPFYVGQNSSIAPLISKNQLEANVESPVLANFDREGLLTLISEQYVSTKGIALVAYSLPAFNEVMFSKRKMLKCYMLQFTSV